MESRQEIHDRYINNLDKYVDSAKETSKYSLERFDILIISLSTSALILSIGFVKNIIPEIHKIDTSLLRTSWLLFVIALISNLISQVTGYYANEKAIKIAKSKIKKERGKSIKGDNDKLEKRKSLFDKLTIGLNGFSLLILIIGIIVLVIFFSNNL